MQGSENRITNASLIGHTIHSATFFASTTIIALATMLSMFDRCCAALDGFDLTIKLPGALAEAVGLLALAVLAQTSFRLSLAVRQLSHCLANRGGTNQADAGRTWRNRWAPGNGPDGCDQQLQCWRAWVHIRPGRDELAPVPGRIPADYDWYCNHSCCGGSSDL